tara:strand:+ start:1857 stop:2357 length:501 start_codon:yes stop_codon:yes gene_type:complete
MWVVAKIKKKEIKIFKKDLIEKLGKDIQFYCPKIIYQKYFGNKVKKIEKFILENYIFCYHAKFKKASTISEIKYLKGLIYFLNGSDQNQKELIQFIEYCKSFENKDGYLTPLFFKTMVTKKAKFLSGPFTNMMFEILERQKNKLKILVGNIVTTISDNNNYLYCPI